MRDTLLFREYVAVAERHPSVGGLIEPSPCVARRGRALLSSALSERSGSLNKSRLI